MKKVYNYLLIACVVTLALICYLSISGPLHFDQTLTLRETVVKERLMKIRTSEEQYKKDKGIYAANFETLINSGYLSDTLRLIPYSDGESFQLKAATLENKSGDTISVMECGAEYQQYLKGLDEDMISGLISSAIDMGQYPGLKIGDITKETHNQGNWE